MTRCEGCGRQYPPVTAWPLHCRCGHRTGMEKANTSELLPVVTPWPCVHRGKPIGRIDCGCGGDSRVFACEVHGEAIIRRLKPGKGPAAVCCVCDDRREGD